MILGGLGEGKELVGSGILGDNRVGAPDVLHLENLVGWLDAVGVELVKL